MESKRAKLLVSLAQQGTSTTTTVRPEKGAPCHRERTSNDDDLAEDRMILTMDENLHPVAESPCPEDVSADDLAFMNTIVGGKKILKEITPDNNVGILSTSLTILPKKGTFTKPNKPNTIRKNLFPSSENGSLIPGNDQDTGTPIPETEQGQVIADFTVTPDGTLTVNALGEGQLLTTELADVNNIEEIILPARDEAEVAASPSKAKRKRTAPSLIPNDGTPKKRKRNTSNWKSSRAKLAHSRGISHRSLRGIEVRAKEIGPGCGSTCPHKCHEEVSDEERKIIFKSFYGIVENERKWDFISRLVTPTKVERGTTDEDFSRRQKTHLYHFHLSNDSKVRVCKKFFLHTLDQSEQIIKTALSKQQGKVGTISPDKRGKHPKLKQASAATKVNVRAHISSFKAVESHYCRKTSTWKYLPKSLNVRKMHSMYIMERGEKAPNTASYRQYLDIFREFKIKFLKPKKDQCAQCLNWASKNNHQKQDEEKKAVFDTHILNKRRGFELKEEDTKKVKTDPELCVVSMDFQQILQCPKGNNSEFYYKSKLKCYNFSIFEHGIKQGHCYVWDQTVAGKAATEVSSCIYDFIKIKAAAGIKKIVVYSDNCWSQNKNKILFSMYNMASFQFDLEITHRYLEKGHTHMEVDSMHALIERTSQNIDVFTPSQWYAIMRAAKKTGLRYRVVEMPQANFKKFEEVLGHLNWSKVSVSKVREIVVLKNDVHFKYKYDEEASKISVLPVRAGRPVKWDTFPLKSAYQGKLKVAENVIKDLKDLCKKDNIPETSLPFYEKLFREQEEPSSNDLEEDCEDGCETCEEAAHVAENSEESTREEDGDEEGIDEED